jgi:hypothetical protein
MYNILMRLSLVSLILSSVGVAMGQQAFVASPRTDDLYLYNFKDYKLGYDTVYVNYVISLFADNMPTPGLVYTGYHDINYNHKCHTNGQYIYGTKYGNKLFWGDESYIHDFTGGENRLGASMMMPMPGKEDKEVLYLFASLPLECIELAPSQVINIWGVNYNFAFQGKSLNYMVVGVDSSESYIKQWNTVFVDDNHLDFTTWLGTRHANGRDWWFFYPQFNSNQYHKILIDPDGPHDLGIFEIDSTFYVSTQSKTAVVSNNGEKLYWLACTRFANIVHDINIDRCTGDLSHEKTYIMPISHPTSGPARNKEYSFLDIAISPNDRYLYLSNSGHWNAVDSASFLFGSDYLLDDTYQLDLETATTYDPERTLVFTDTVVNFIDSTSDASMDWSYMGGDFKIYYCNFYNNMLSQPDNEGMGLIRFPNRPGTACGFDYAGLGAETPLWMPNYFLGPLDGSSCDTLGLDSYPKAIFTEYSQDQHLFDFEDYSMGDPVTWYWDFGDGQTTDTVQSPKHLYTQDGLYTVCLTVSNNFGTDTYCRMIQVGNGPVSTDEHLAVGEIAVFPNPVQDHFSIVLPGHLQQEGQIAIFNSSGQQVQTFAINGHERQQFVFPNLPVGVYFYRITITPRLAAEPVQFVGKLVHLNAN